MTFETALRATEILLAIAFIQQSCEFLANPLHNRIMYVCRIALSLGVLIGASSIWFLLGLAVISLAMLHYYNGPYNGGSDKMSILVLSCVLLAHISGTEQLKHAAFGYLAAQLTLSYFVSGWVKLINAQWRSGQALQDVFAFSAYPVSKSLRNLAHYPVLLRSMSWTVIGFEVLFPLALLSTETLIVALVIGAVFHLANACLFGLNRFLSIWLSAYPALFWFQMQFFAT